MISHPLFRSRSSIVDQGPVCRARGRTRRTSARHFPRVGHRPDVHGFMPCRLHAAALFCASKASTRRCCDPRARFRQAAVGPPDQPPPGQNRAKYHPPRWHPPAGWGVAGRIPPPSTVCASSAVEEAPKQARITSIPALLASGVLASKRPLPSCQNSRPVPAIAVTPLRRADPSQAIERHKEATTEKPGFSTWEGEIPRDTDSPLEGDEFELLVPRHESRGFSEASRASRMPLAPGEGDVAKPRRSRLRCFPQNGTAPLVKVPAPSGPAAFPLQDATVGSRNRGAGQRDHQKYRFPARPSAVTSHLSPTRTCNRTKARAAPEAPAVTHLPPRADAQQPRRSHRAATLCCPTAVERQDLPQTRHSRSRR
jgi:hypothetical protein